MRRPHENRPTRFAARIGFVILAFALLPSRPAQPRDAAPVYVAEVVNPELTNSLLVPGSGVLLLAGSDGTILRSTDGVRWNHAITPSNADLARLAANDKGTTLLAAGARGTLLRSADAGRTWQAATHSILDTDLEALVYHAPSGCWLAAGTNGRLLRSKDDGRTFSELTTNLTLDFHALFVDPETRDILIGGDQGAIGCSTDAGESWQVTMIAMPEPVTPVTAFHRFGKLLLATSALGTLPDLDDDARSWDLLQSELEAFFTDAAFDAAHGALVLAGHNGDVVRSADGGDSWQCVELTTRRHARTSSRRCTSMRAAARCSRSAKNGAARAFPRRRRELDPRPRPTSRGEIRGLLAAPSRLVAFGNGGRVVLHRFRRALEIARAGVERRCARSSWHRAAR